MNFKFIYWCLVLFLLLVSCKNKEESNQLMLNSNQKLDILDKYSEFQKIAVLTENGCLTCNESMAMQLEEWLGDSTVAIVIEASGVRIDISNIINNKKYNNVYIDMKAELSNHFNQNNNSFIINKKANKSEIIPVNTSNISKFKLLLL